MPDVCLWHWLVFGAVIVVLLVLDMAVVHRSARAASLRESALWTLFWCSLAGGFNVLVFAWRGKEAGLQFLTGYLVEWSLSIDNVFVFAVIFRAFHVARKYQYRVLFWGILGAIVMRLTFILAGVGLIRRFDWLMFVFGLFLVYTAVKLAMPHNEEVDPEKNFLLRLARRLFRVTRQDHGQRFFARENGKRCVTPLFLVLLVVESTDVLFAVDSVPAILGITRDAFILFTSNIFAILGLRALYFLLAGAIEMFRYLHYGLSGVLGFVGLKMIGEYWLAPEHGHLIHPAASLAVIVGVLAASIGASLLAQRRERT